MLKTCKFCNELFEIPDNVKFPLANHTRWCNKNPKRESYNKGNTAGVAAMLASKKKTIFWNQYSKAKALGLPIPEGLGKGGIGYWTGRKHTEESKNIMREKALASPHRRLRRKMIDYKGVTLDSTWELVLAQRLDELNIKWVRPKPIVWVCEDNIKHHYFADFYLVEYDLYLDPKNPFAIKAQKNKLKHLLEQYKNIIILDTIEKCKDFKISYPC